MYQCNKVINHIRLNLKGTGQDNKDYQWKVKHHKKAGLSK